MLSGRSCWIVVGALAAGACGSSSPTGNQPDAGGPGIDAHPAGGTVTDFDFCVAGSKTPAEVCAGATSDCLADPADGSGNTFRCMPKCTTSMDCDITTFCVPDAGGTGGAAFGAIADHCYIAWCGQNPNSAIHNGTTGGPCQVGGQTGENDIAGWCDPIDDGDYGFCFDVGTVASGSSCNPNANRGSTDQQCDVTDICVTSQNPPSNLCDKLCDPTTFLASGDATGGGACTGGDNCYDGSSMITFTGSSPFYSTVGFCNSKTVCDVTKTGGCAALSVAGNLWGCVPSTPVRADGFCDPIGNGTLAIGTSCDLTKITNGDATQCVEGSQCYQASGTSAATCLQTCSFDAGGTACTTGSCTKVTIDPGRDGVIGTEDDQVSQTWGLCM